MEISPEELKCKETQLKSILDAAARDANRLVADHRDAISTVARLLVERRKLRGDEVAAIVNEFGPPDRVVEN
jgi:ATP-dependent Zn protease